MGKLFNKGFSLPEVLIAAGLASGLGLVIAKLSQDASRVSKSTETNNEINMLVSDVAYILSDKDSCSATIPVGSSSSGYSPGAIRRVLPDGTIKDVYLSGPTHRYGNGTFSIKSMTTELSSTGSVDLVFTIERLSQVALSADEIKRRVPLKVTLDAGNNIQSCYSDTDSIIATAVEAACRGETARWDPGTQTCWHDIDTATACPAGKVLRNVVGNNKRIESVCVDIIENEQTCPDGSFLKGIAPNGDTVCAKIGPTSCGAGQYAAVKATGEIECRNFQTCTGNNVLRTTATGALTCVSINCDSTKQYFAGFDASGSAICKDFPHKDCGPGQIIQEITRDGYVKCKPVPPEIGLNYDPFSFPDGYDLSTGTWRRKTITQIAEQVCNTISGFSWNGTNCLPSASATTPPTCTGDNYLQFDGTNYICTPTPWKKVSGGIEYGPGDFKMRIYDYGQTAFIYKGTTSVSIGVNGTSLGAHGPGGIISLNRSADNTATYRSVTISHGRVYINGDVTVSSPTGGSEIDFGYNHKIHALNGIQFDEATSFSIGKGATCSSSDAAKIRFAKRSGAGDYRFWGCIYWNGKWQWREMSWFD